MLRVLQVISDTNIGGAGRYLLTLLENHDRSRLRMQVLCPPGSLLIERCRGLGVEVFTSPHLSGDRSFSCKNLVPLLLDIRRLIKEQQIDLMHTHASFAGRLAARLVGVPAVFTRHRLDWEAPKKGIKKKAFTLINNLTSSRVIAVSEAVRESLIAEGMPRERIALIYNGIDVERFRQEAARSDARASLGLGSAPVVGTVGRLEAEKGHRCFLEAAARIKKEYPDAVFLVVGDGSLAGDLKEQARNLGLEERVVFTGFREDVPQLMAAMDVLVVPSLTEAFGFSLVEGMCLGRPCVASSVGGIKEIAEDGRTALLAAPGDAGETAEKVLYLLRNKSAASEMGERAALEVERRFSARVMTDSITVLYYQIS